MLCLDFCRAVKQCIGVFQQSAGSTGVLMAHDAIAGSDPNFTYPGRCREGQAGGTVFGNCVHGQVLSVHVLFGVNAGGRNLCLRLPVKGLPVGGHANGDSRRCRCRNSGRAGERAYIRIVHSIYIYIGSFSFRIKIGILNFGRCFPLDGIDVHRTVKIDRKA